MDDLAGGLRMLRETVEHALGKHMEGVETSSSSYLSPAPRCLAV